MAIKVATNFEILDIMPIDTRFVVENESELANLKAYAGLEVYIKSTSIKKRYTGSEWITLNDLDITTVVPKAIKNDTSISILPNDVNRSNAYFYIDNDGQSSKISMKDLLDKKIRTVSSQPTDLQVGDYILIKLEE